MRAYLERLQAVEDQRLRAADAIMASQGQQEDEEEEEAAWLAPSYSNPNRKNKPAAHEVGVYFKDHDMHWVVVVAYA
jgi:hypothetical protein